MTSLNGSLFFSQCTTLSSLPRLLPFSFAGYCDTQLLYMTIQDQGVVALKVYNEFTYTNEGISGFGARFAAVHSF